ncbi:MAG TPA: hypothetical protein VK061_09660 [Bacillota bacterium]|nr:hypothetical protein [Bacillota bacterium]
MGEAPLVYSNEQENKKQQFFLAGFFAFLFIVFLIMGISLSITSGKWWVMLFIGPIVLLLGVLSFGFFPKKKDEFYKMSVYDDKLVQEWKQKESPDVHERTIYFSDVSYCLIGIISREISGAEEKTLYRYHALLMMKHKDGKFRQEILTNQELYEWRRRLHDKVGQLMYAKEDVTTYVNQRVDIENIPATEDNIISEYIEKESNRPFS